MTPGYKNIFHMLSQKIKTNNISFLSSVNNIFTTENEVLKKISTNMAQSMNKICVISMM